MVRRVASEALGTAFLLMAVVGSGIMGERLAGGNAAIALLANSVATGGALVALILTFGPISGGHFNPVVTIAHALQAGIAWREVPGYVAAQVVGAFAGVGAANEMFGLPLFFMSHHVRSGRSYGERMHCHVWAAVCDRGMFPKPPAGCGFRGCLHYCGVLVYLLDVVCESRGDAGPGGKRHLCRNPSHRCARIHLRAAGGNGSRRFVFSLAASDAPQDKLRTHEETTSAHPMYR